MIEAALRLRLGTCDDRGQSAGSGQKCQGHGPPLGVFVVVESKSLPDKRRRLREAKDLVSDLGSLVETVLGLVLAHQGPEYADVARGQGACTIDDGGGLFVHAYQAHLAGDFRRGLCVEPEWNEPLDRKLDAFQIAIAHGDSKGGRLAELHRRQIGRMHRIDHVDGLVGLPEDLMHTGQFQAQTRIAGVGLDGPGQRSDRLDLLVLPPMKSAEREVLIRAVVGRGALQASAETAKSSSSRSAHS